MYEESGRFQSHRLVKAAEPGSMRPFVGRGPAHDVEAMSGVLYATPREVVVFYARRRVVPRWQDTLCGHNARDFLVS